MTRDGVQEARAELSPDRDAGGTARYDFERLERAVEFLIEEHERLTTEKEALLEELVERERRITSLQAEIESERKRRLSAVEGVDKILGRLEHLQASVSAAAEPA